MDLASKLECTLSFTLDSGHLTHAQILELHEAVTKSRTCTVIDLAITLKCDPAYLRSKISKIKQKKSALRGERRSSYLNEICQLDALGSVETSRPTVSSDVQSTVDSATIQVLQDEVNRMKSFVEEAAIKQAETKEEAEKGKQLKRKNSSLKETLDRKRKKYNIVRLKLKNVSQRQDKGRITKAKQKISQQQRIISELKKNAKKLNKTIKELTQENLSMEEQLNVVKSEMNESYETHEHEQKALEEENSCLQTSLTYAESLLNDQSSNIIQTFDNDNQTYTTDFQLCVMNLLSEGVGVHHVNSVVEHVSNLCGKTVDRLPTTTTINRISDQRGSVAHMHIKDKLIEETNTCLLSDETRKHGDCYEVFAIRDPGEKEWVIGLKDMTNKSSESCLETLKSVVNDISDSTNTECGKRILAQIKNTMSDRAASEKKFHELLQGYREELLPSIFSNWNSLSETEKTSLSKINNFYCGLHLLVNFADIAHRVIHCFEQQDITETESSSSKKKEESGSIRLVRTTAKCLARGGDEKSGCYTEFKTYMNVKDKEEDIENQRRGSMLVAFRGNRFNILFFDAEVVFYLAEHIQEFFDKVHPPSNKLQQAVFTDIKIDRYLAVIKALGLCSKIITGPFWRILENKQCTLQNANDMYQTLYHYLEVAKDDSTDVVLGTNVPFEDQMKKDVVFDRLMKPDTFDAQTVVVLQQIFSAWYTLLLKAASDHLVGGRFATVHENLKEETQSVPRHNKFPERVFALLDALTRFRPVASTLCNESYIMFSLNKTGEWLHSLSESEKRNYLSAARKEGRELREKYKRRIIDIEDSRRDALNKKREALLKKANVQVLQRENVINSMLYYGLWQTPDSVDHNLKLINSDSERKKALKVQLQFRRLILGQHHQDKTVFQFSEKGKAYTIEKLTENVKILVKSAFTIHRTDQETNMFIGKRVVHYLDNDNVRTPYYARVISCVPGYPQWYNLKYDNDPAIYVYLLAQEYSNGDLEVSMEDAVNTPGSGQKKKTSPGPPQTPTSPPHKKKRD